LTQIETPITTQDIKIIKRKAEKTKFYLLLLISFIGLWAWGMSDTESLFSIFNAFVLFFIIVTIIVFVFSIKRLKATRKDLKAQIKIVSTFKVIDKYRSGRNNHYYYKIVFDSKDIPNYEVTKHNYPLINIGDSISIEYSKFAFCILKIEHQGHTIENKHNIQ